MVTLVVVLILVAILTFIIVKSVVIVRQAEAVVIERLGKYYTTLSSGVNVIIPFLDLRRGASAGDTLRLTFPGRSLSDSDR